LKGINFGNIAVKQTLFNYPWEIKRIDEIKKGYGEGSFVIITGEK